MQVKEYLGTVNRLNRIIQNKLSDLHQLKELAVSIPAIENKDRVQTTPEFDKIGKALARIDETEREIDYKVDIYIQIKDKIIEQISSINDEKYYNVLFLKYIENEKFESIAIKTERSFKHIARLHREAIEEFDRKYGETYHSLENLADILKTFTKEP